MNRSLHPLTKTLLILALLGACVRSTFGGDNNSSAALVFTPAFYRAVNINGAAITVDGNSFEASSGAANLSISQTGGGSFANQSVTLVPSTDANRATMIRSSVYGTAVNLTMSSVPNGYYDIYLYVWEDSNPQTYSVSVEGSVVQSNYNSGSAGTWAKLGPYRTNITDGTINITSSGGHANFSGVEVWTANNPPVISNAIPDHTAIVNDNFIYTVPSNTFSDPDAGTTLTYSASLSDGNPLPSWLSFNASTRKFSGTPGAGDTGTINVRVTVSDDELTASDIFALNVTTGFYRALNLNGAAIAIDGNSWEASSGASNFSYTQTGGGTFSNQSITLIPTTDANRATMIRSSIYGNPVNLNVTSVPNGTYDVSIYVLEDNFPETYSVSLEGTVVLANYNSGSAGVWKKLGPFRKLITDGVINVSASGGTANIGGIEILRGSTGEVPVTEVTVSPTTMTLAIGEANKLTSSVIPANATTSTLNWSSGNTSVATVDANGLVRAVAAGTAVITATSTDGGFTGTSTVTVTSAGSNSLLNPEFDLGLNNWIVYDFAGTPLNQTSVVQGAGLSGNNSLFTDIANGTSNGWGYQIRNILPFRLEVGRTYRISYMAKAQSARTMTALLSGLSTTYWSTSSSVTTSVQKFTYQYTCTQSGVANEPNFFFQFHLANGTVSDIWLDNVRVEDITGITAVTGLALSPSPIALVAGQTGQITKTFTPSNATNQEVTWSSDNTSIATVDNTGLVTAVAAGSAGISAYTTNGGYTATTTVNVSANIPVTGVTVSPASLSLTPGQTAQLTKTIAPANATNQNVNWSSSDTGIATVSGSGVVTAVAPGTATITATSVSGSITGTSSLTVLPAGSNGTMNPEFDLGLTNWTYYDGTGVSNPWSVVTDAGLSGANALYIDIVSNSNTYWQLQPKQVLNFNLQSGRTYAISFMAKAQSARNITVALRGEISNSDYWNSNAALTTSPQTFNFVFPFTGTPNPSDTQFSVAFYLAMGVVSDVWIDKVLVEDITGVTAVTGVSVSPATLNINTGATGQLSATITPANATNQNVSWTSSNTAVATVSSTGLVTGVSAGTATITATTQNGGRTATSAITVTDIAVTGVSIAPTTLSLSAGQTGQLTRTIAPSNATNQTVNWTSGNTAVATVNSSGLVTAVAPGEATITATTVSGGFTATAAVTVVIPVTGVSVSPTALTLTAGQTAQLTETVSPANATNQTVTWSSSNTSVATVDNTGLVTASSLAGSATITATTTDGAFTAQAVITVEEVASPATVLAKFAFLYKYDDRKRMTHKKVPGADWVYMVYDDRDRLVMTQDGNQRTKSTREWTFTKYDVLNRPILTGIYLDAENKDQAGMQTTVNDFYIAAENNSDEWFEVTGGTVHGYTNQSFPNVSSEGQYLTVSYYDDYSFISLIGAGASDYQYDNTRLVSSGNDEGQEDQAFTRVKGQMTGTRIKNLGTNEWMWSVTYYDDRYRAIQVIAQNSKGGLDKTTNVYDFAGKVLRTKTDHAITGATPIATTRKLTYDHAGRLLQTEHQTNNKQVVIAKNEYNEIGQLVTKKLHSEDNAQSFKQHVDYRYNIRGWLSRINNSDLGEADSGPKDYFGMELGYNTEIGVGASSLQYNGNISAIKYSTNQGLGINDSASQIFEATQRGYAFAYDPLNRLKEADHRQKNYLWNPTTAYREGALQYDLNGNILHLDRKGKDGADMDELVYTYNGNRLMQVTDAEDALEGFKDGNVSGDDYLYDANGNMITDKNKNIDTITYNHLNLPAIVIKSTGEHVNYIYNAAGVKMSQEVYDAANTLTKKTDYLGEFFYENDTLKFINHEEGRVVMTGTEPEYQYTLKDHLRNSRVTFTSRVEEETYTATLEDNTQTGEQNTFTNYSRVTNDLLDHTDAGTVYDKVLVLNGGYNGQVGLAKSFAVVPGDTISATVYAKYIAGTGSASNLTNFAAALTQAFGLTSSLPGEAATAFEALNSVGSVLATAGRDEDDDNAPKGFVNILVFDKDYNLVDFSYEQIDAAYVQDGGAKVFYPQLTAGVRIRHAGYAYVFLSNEGSTEQQIGFDDYSVTHGHSAVIQQDDYYPFGLTFNSYQRQSSVPNRYKFQAQEHVNDLGLHWDAFKWRNHQPDIGRFFNVDPLAEKYYYNSPYAFSENKVTSHIELEGLEAISVGVEPIDVVNAMIPTPKPTAETKILNGTSNMFFGAVGTVAAASWVIGTEGVGMALGGGTACGLCIGEFTMGMTQVIDGVHELTTGEPLPASDAIQGSNTILGLAATGSENAEMIDAIGSLLPGTLTGTNIISLAKAPQKLVQSKSAREGAFNVANTIDTILDMKGGYDAVKDAKNKKSEAADKVIWEKISEAEASKIISFLSRQR